MKDKTQVLTALAQATETRVWRAEQKHEVDGGNTQLACELLLSGDHRLKTMPIGDFLEWLPGIGPFRAKRCIMEDAFHWYTDRTPQRQMGGLDLATCLRIVSHIKRLYEDEAVAA